MNTLSIFVFENENLYIKIETLKQKVWIYLISLKIILKFF